MTSVPVRTSLRLNNDVPVAEFVEIATLAESLGFDQLWVSNDLFLRSAPVMLAAAATATSRLHLGTCILNPYTVHPTEIAMVAATLQELSGGRFLLGIAAGAADFLDWVGIEQDAPLRRTRDAIVAIRALCNGESPSDIAGLDSSWGSEAYMRIDARPTPIYLGAMSPRMARLIGEVADGGLPLLYPPESYVDVAAQIAAGAATAGRSMDDVDVAACIWVSIADDDSAARRALADKLGYFAPSFSPTVLGRVGLTVDDVAHLRGTPDPGALVSPELMTLGIAGDADTVVARCRGLIDAGARHISFGPPLGPDRLAAIRILGRDVLPRLAAQLP